MVSMETGASCDQMVNLNAMTHRATTRNWSIWESFSWLSGSHTFVSSFSWTRLSVSPTMRQNQSTLINKTNVNQINLNNINLNSKANPKSSITIITGCPLLSAALCYVSSIPPSASFSGISAWYLEPTLISPWSASRVFWTGSNTKE